MKIIVLLFIILSFSTFMNNAFEKCWIPIYQSDFKCNVQCMHFRTVLVWQDDKLRFEVT